MKKKSFWATDVTSYLHKIIDVIYCSCDYCSCDINLCIIAWNLVLIVEKKILIFFLILRVFLSKDFFLPKTYVRKTSCYEALPPGHTIAPPPPTKKDNLKRLYPNLLYSLKYNV